MKNSFRESKVKIKKDCVWKEIDGQVMVLDPEEGLIMELNSTASCLWVLMRKGIFFAQLIEGLRKEFQVDEKEAEKDADEFLAFVKKKGFLQIVS